MRLLLYSLLLSSLLFSLNFEIYSADVVNGSTSLVEFKKDKNIKYEKITLGKKNFKIYQNPLNQEKLYALIPISYYDKPSQRNAEIHYKEGAIRKTKFISLQIKQGDYKKESIQVTESKVNPSKEHRKRIEKEYHEAMKIYATSTNKNQLNSKFILPLDSVITSDFGKARVYNDALKGYHSGTDFRAAVGTPIVASNDGVVVLVKDRFYSGGTVILDHGQGVYTCYYHMSKLDCKIGEKIQKGEIMGLSGQSGRVTGPHLHFSVRVGGVQVDPLQFVTLMNSTLLSKSTSTLGIPPR